MLIQSDNSQLFYHTFPRLTIIHLISKPSDKNTYTKYRGETMIGERLQDIRKDHSDTQQDLADKLHASLYVVCCWEQGKSDPSHDTLVAICKLYGVSADYLLGLTDEDPIYSQRRQKNNLNTENLATLKRFEAFLYNEQERQGSHHK